MVGVVAGFGVAWMDLVWLFSKSVCFVQWGFMFAAGAGVFFFGLGGFWAGDEGQGLER